MLIPSLSNALAARGYDTLTPVQQAVTDPALGEADLLVSAQTGSGKTVGFGLAIGPTLLGNAERLPPAAAPLALVVAPTRELAFQVMRELSWLYAEAGARVVTCVGGMDMREERRALERGAHIVVGTPGRLCDHIRRGGLDMGSLRAVVLDEADEMLDLGFREDLEFMLAAAPQDRRTLMFSATVPPTIARLAQQFQRDAVRVTTLSGTTQHADIAYQALRVAPQDAEAAVINLLRYHDAQNAIVFANTRAVVARLTARLANRGFAVVSLSGELSQSERTHALQAMRDGRARVCVATDVAARGIDLPNLDLVIHAELPSNAEGLLHRSGRTGRAGRKGISALVVPVRATKKAERLLQFARITADWIAPPTPEDIAARDRARLLADPIWSETPTEAESVFAAELLALHGPEEIAAAYLRLYLSRWSAPEELDTPETRAPERERAPFGPSTWFSLSVGATGRAEARWLLPLLCRAGNLEKSAIGAIRVQADETLVELSTSSVPGFLASLGEGGQLDEGITARPLEKAPDPSPSPRGPRPARTGHPDRKERPERGPRPAPRPTAPLPAAPRQAAPARRAEKPKPETAPAREAVTPDRTAGTQGPAKRSASDSAARPPARKPWAADRPKQERKPAPTAGKPFGKSKGKPAPRKPAAPPAETEPRRNPAADPSRRFTPPGKSAKPARSGAAGTKTGARGPHKSGGKPASPGPRRGPGGATPPRRRP